MVPFVGCLCCSGGDSALDIGVKRALSAVAGKLKEETLTLVSSYNSCWMLSSLDGDHIHAELAANHAAQGTYRGERDHVLVAGRGWRATWAVTGKSTWTLCAPILAIRHVDLCVHAN
jgi:hypothetical protein